MNAARKYFLGRRAGRWPALIFVTASAACESPRADLNLQRRMEALRVDNDRLERELQQCQNRSAELRERIERLEAFEDARAADLFDPVKLEILKLSRGKDLDETPGDDGVEAHFRPLDRDGNVTPAGGKITVELVDHSVMGEPRVVGVKTVSDSEELRMAWHGRFLANQYVVTCPFDDAVERPRGSTVEMTVELLDYRTGKRLRERKTVDIQPSRADREPSESKN